MFLDRVSQATIIVLHRLAATEVTGEYRQILHAGMAHDDKCIYQYHFSSRSSSYVETMQYDTLGFYWNANKL